jgi:hypothetical protein
MVNEEDKNKFKESQFAEYVERKLKEILPELSRDLIPEKNANLLYQISLDNNLNPMIKATDPKRGHFAFQTDLCIFLKKDRDIKIPKVVIELKNNPTTHDIITYSSKARKHKSVYPYVRYGLISYNISKIPGRFFLHNDSLDFCLALKDYLTDQDDELLNHEGISMLKNLIKAELETSDLLDMILFNKYDYNYFRTNIEFKNLTGNP